MLQSWCNNNYSLGMGSRKLCICMLYRISHRDFMKQSKLLFLLSNSTHSIFCWDNLRTMKLVSANGLILPLVNNTLQIIWKEWRIPWYWSIEIDSLLFSYRESHQKHAKVTVMAILHVSKSCVVLQTNKNVLLVLLGFLLQDMVWSTDFLLEFWLGLRLRYQFSLHLQN